MHIVCILSRYAGCVGSSESEFQSQDLTREDTVARGEQRFVSVGTDSIGRILVVVYTHRGENIRLISARDATGRERKAYEEGI